jgi:hypothetical protein
MGREESASVVNADLNLRITFCPYSVMKNESEPTQDFVRRSIDLGNIRAISNPFPTQESHGDVTLQQPLAYSHLTSPRRLDNKKIWDKSYVAFSS